MNNIIIFGATGNLTIKKLIPALSEIYKKRFPDLYKILPELDKKVKFMTQYKLNADIRKFDF